MSKNGREPLYVVRNSRIHGRGVFATRYIRKGTRIVEYTGERITNKESDRRYDDTKMKRHHTFLFTLDSKTVIDGAIDKGGGGCELHQSFLRAELRGRDNGEADLHSRPARNPPGNRARLRLPVRANGQERREAREVLLLQVRGANRAAGSIVKPGEKKAIARTIMSSGGSEIFRGRSARYPLRRWRPASWSEPPNSSFAPLSRGSPPRARFAKRLRDTSPPLPVEIFGKRRRGPCAPEPGTASHVLQ